jgi:glycyl-tRNA synthetase beta subunit
MSRAAEAFAPFEKWDGQRLSNLLALHAFIQERYQYGLEQRGFDGRNVRAVVQSKAFEHLSPSSAFKLLTAMAGFVDSTEFVQLASAFKRVKNLAKELDQVEFQRLELMGPTLSDYLKHPSELALLDQIDKRKPVIERAVALSDHYSRALSEASGFKPFVDKFFDDVRVKTDDPRLTEARLRLLRRLEELILKLADISEIVAEEGKQV